MFCSWLFPSFCLNTTKTAAPTPQRPSRREFRSSLKCSEVMKGFNASKHGSGDTSTCHRFQRCTECEWNEPEKTQLVVSFKGILLLHSQNLKKKKQRRKGERKEGEEEKKEKTIKPIPFWCIPKPCNEPEKTHPTGGFI